MDKNNPLCYSSFKNVVLPKPTSRKYSSSLSTVSSKSLQSVRKSESGTKYAEQYIKDEEKQLLEQASQQELNNADFDKLTIDTYPERREIMDADINKLYLKYNFEHQEEKPLSINHMRNKIISMIDTNSVVVIEGPTGCGKTTQVPQFILDNCYKKKSHCNIIVTQPRRIAAISIAKRVSEERNWDLGAVVGYKVGMLNKTSPDTRLTYCTFGVLLRHLISNKSMLDFTHIILDEVHERNQEMDFLLLVVRKLLRTNSRSVKVILMSATINGDKFANYFSSSFNDKIFPAPIITIPENRTFDIHKYYLCQLENLGQLPEVLLENPRVTSEMMDFCTKLVKEFDEIDDDGHRHVVLIFLPGIWEIEEMHQILTNYGDVNEAKWDVAVLHSSITNEEQQVIFELPPEGYRRIILSTNIAESSITVPDVKYVIDFCLSKILITNQESNFQTLEIGWTSKANCDQRAGRTGRTMNGRVYRLVPKLFYERNLVDEIPPEIQRAPLEHIVLNTKLLDMGSPKQLLALAMDPPDITNLENTILLLKEIGALLNATVVTDPYDGNLTQLGVLMAHLPVNIHIAKLIALGHAFGVLKSTIIIGASMTTKSVFSSPFKKKLQAYSTKLNWSQGSCSDCIAFLNVYNTWLAEKASRTIHNKQSEKAWAARNFLQLRVLYEIHSLVQELTMRLKHLGIIIPTGVQNFDDPNQSEYGFILKTVIAGAFYPNYFYNVNIGEYHEREGLKTIAGLDPKRTIFLKGWPNNQPGPLYTKHLQRIFQDCCGVKQMNKIRVTFDYSNKVLITFGSDAMKFKHADDPEDFSTPGKISNAVYRGLKMRDDNKNILVPLIRPQEAEKLAKEMKIPKVFGVGQFLRAEYQANANGVNSNENKNKALIYLYKRPILPGLKTLEMPITITQVEDPSQFWVQSLNDDIQHLFKLINREIQDNSKLVPLDHKPVNGELVIVTLTEENESHNRRAVVVHCNMENHQEKVGIFCIDYGTIHEILISNLRQFCEPNDVMNIPSLAFECNLLGINPAESRRVDCKYTTEARNAFIKIINQSKCHAEIYSVVNSVVAIKLFCDLPNQQRIEMNSWLIEKGFAQLREEDFQSKQNHEIRLDVAHLTNEQIQFYETNQYDRNELHYNVPQIDESQCDTSVLLKGPYSPLEMELSSLVIAGNGKKVKISSMSVNSVLLNTEPGGAHHRLVVAGQIHQNIAGSCLNIDTTTLMPNILGLTTFIPLIFAPKIELRRNKFGNRYSSAICGLGFNDINECSLFGEHDMEIGIDIVIDNNDLLMVNKVRNLMSIILNLIESEDIDQDGIVQFQQSLRQTYMKIFEKERKSQKVELTGNVGQWKQFDQKLLLKPDRNKNMKKNIYALHDALELTSFDPIYEEMTEYLIELKKLVAEDPKKFNQELVCRFCNETVFGIFELRNHIMKPSHDDNIRKFGLNPY